VQTVQAAEIGTRTIVGTYGYMPQEQFGGRTVPASDLYSFGCTIIYLVTGTNPADLPQHDFRIQFEQLANFSPNLTNWLKWMTETSLEKRLSSADKALHTLNESLVKNISNLAIDKPVDTIIQLTKNQDVLDILIAYRMSWSLVCRALFSMITSSVPLLLFQIGWYCLVIWLTISCLSASFPLNLFSFTVLLPFWYVILYWLYPYLQVLHLLVGVRVRLHINSQKITLTRELFGLKFHSLRPSPRSSISKLVYIPEHLLQIKGFQNQTEVAAKLELWAGVKKYQLSNYTTTEAEREWLAYELSKFLDIPIEED
jgi:serine/threonine protein kinase